MAALLGPAAAPVLATGALAPVDDAAAGLRAPAEEVEVDAAGARRAAVDEPGVPREAADGLAELDDMDEGVAPLLHYTNAIISFHFGTS